MPYGDHYLFSYGGTLGTKGEIWSNNIRLAGTAPLDIGLQIGPALSDMLNDVKTLFSTANVKIGSHVRCTYGKLNKIAPDGTYDSPTASNSKFLTGADSFTGLGSGAPLPFQCAIAISWLTDKARGPGSKGRVFSPGPMVAMDAEGQFSQTDATNIATGYAKLIDDLGNFPGLDLTTLRPVVASKVDGSREEIKRVAVGRVMDTMRSRRNALDENRVLVNVP